MDLGAINDIPFFFSKFSESYPQDFKMDIFIYIHDKKMWYMSAMLMEMDLKIHGLQTPAATSPGGKFRSASKWCLWLGGDGLQWCLQGDWIPGWLWMYVGPVGPCSIWDMLRCFWGSPNTSCHEGLPPGCCTSSWSHAKAWCFSSTVGGVLLLNLVRTKFVKTGGCSWTVFSC